MPRLKLVFDLDDTLYPERQFAISGFRACERWLEQEHGHTGIVDEMTRLLDDGHMRALFDIVLRSRVPHSSEAMLEAFIDIYRWHEPEIGLYADAAHVLEHLEEAGEPLGLITDGQHEVQASKVRALRLEPRLLFGLLGFKLRALLVILRLLLGQFGLALRIGLGDAFRQLGHAVLDPGEDARHLARQMLLQTARGRAEHAEALLHLDQSCRVAPIRIGDLVSQMRENLLEIVRFASERGQRITRSPRHA